MFMLVAALAALAVGSSALATAPAKNGRIAFRRYLDASHQWGTVFTIDASGKGERQLTHPRRGAGFGLALVAMGAAREVCRRTSPAPAHSAPESTPEGGMYL
jgi:hypothetical protein